MFLQKFLKNSFLTSVNLPRIEIKEVTKTTNKLCFHNSTISKTTQPLPKRIEKECQEVGTPDKLHRLIEIEVRGNDPAVLKSYAWYATTAAHHLGIEVGKSWTPAKPHHERFTVLRSIHVNKKCRVQYEFRTYFHFMQFLRLTGSTADTFLEYIQRNLPEGVAMKVTKCSLEVLPDHIKEPEKDNVIEAT